MKRYLRTPFGPVEEPMPWLLAGIWVGIGTVGCLGVVSAVVAASLMGWVPIDLHDVFNEPY
jgi:hypothetical protein